MDAMDVVFRGVFGFLKAIVKIYIKLWQIGAGWFVTGLLFDWALYWAQKDSDTATMTGNQLIIAHVICWWVIAVGFTALHILNVILSRKLGYKTNWVFVLFKKVFGKSAADKVKGGVQTALKAVSVPVGIIFGRDSHGKYFLQDEDAAGSTGVFGTPGSGKSQGVFIPTLLSYGSKSLDKPVDAQPSVFVVDVKGELLQASYKYRTETLHRKIKYLSFGDEIIKGVEPCKYDPFAVMDYVENDIQGVTEIASALIPKAKTESNPYFTDQARTLLAGLLYSMYKYPEKISFAECLQMICSVPVDKLIDTFCIGKGTEERPDCSKGWMLLSSFYRQAKATEEAESFANVRDTMLGPLRLVATNDNIINAFDTSSGDVMRPQDLLDGDCYVCIKEQYLDADQPNILNLIVSQYLSFFSRFENNTEKRILFMLDEFPRLGELKKVTEGVNLYRSRGIRFLIAAQSIDQITEKYGKDHFGVLMDGLATVLVLRAVGTSAEYFSKRVGKYDKTIKSKNRGVSSQSMHLGEGMSSGSSESEQERDVFRPSYFENELASNKQLMILAQDGYKVADVCFAYNDRVFSERM